MDPSEELAEDEAYQNWTRISTSLYYAKSSIARIFQAKLNSFHSEIKKAVILDSESETWTEPTDSTAELSQVEFKQVSTGDSGGSEIDEAAKQNPASKTNVRGPPLDLVEQCDACTWRDIHSEADEWTIKCPRHICDKWLREILKYHSNPASTDIPWSNAVIKNWPVDQWQVVVCFMPRRLTPCSFPIPGLKIEDLDLVSILHVFDTCTFFQHFIKHKGRLKEVLGISSRHMMMMGCHISKDKYTKSILSILRLLKDNQCFGKEQSCIEACEKIIQIAGREFHTRHSDRNSRVVLELKANLNETFQYLQKPEHIESGYATPSQGVNSPRRAEENIRIVSYSSEQRTTRDDAIDTYEYATAKISRQGKNMKKEARKRSISDFSAKFDTKRRRQVRGRLYKAAKENDAEALNSLIEDKYIPDYEELRDTLSLRGDKPLIMLQDFLKHLALFIRHQYDFVTHVYVGQRAGQRDNPVFVVTISDNQSAISDNQSANNVKSTLMKHFPRFVFIIRKMYEVSPEGETILFSPECTEKELTLEEQRKLERCCKVCAAKLFSKHSNLCIISGCSVRSKRFGTDKAQILAEICIVLYVHVKGIIPIGEKSFPTLLDGIPVDVREGKFIPYSSHESAKYHPNLLMGCQIGRVGTGLGTLGGFVDLPGDQVGCITCAHVVLKADEMQKYLEADRTTRQQYDAQLPWNTVRIFQPCEGAEFGTVRRIELSEGTRTEAGVDAALVTITDDNRRPNSGAFPAGDHLHAGFTPDDPMVFSSGKIHTIPDKRERSEILKFGSTTGITRGIRHFGSAGVRRSDVVDLIFNVMHNQIEVKHQANYPGFADKGDSGALAFIAYKGDKRDLRAIGMIIGGTTAGTTVVTPIRDILRKLEIRGNRLKCFPSTANLSSSQEHSQRRHFQEQLNRQSETIQKVRRTQSKELKYMERQQRKESRKIDSRFKKLEEKIEKKTNKISRSVRLGFKEILNRIEESLKKNAPSNS